MHGMSTVEGKVKVKRRSVTHGTAVTVVVLLVLATLAATFTAAATVLAEEGETIIPKYTTKTSELVDELRQLGYVVGLGLVVIGAIAYGISTLSSSVDPSQSIQGRSVGIRIVLVGLIIVALCAVAKELACAVAGFFDATPSFCGT